MELESERLSQNAEVEQSLPPARRFEVPDKPRVRRRPAYHLSTGLWW